MSVAVPIIVSDNKTVVVQSEKPANSVVIAMAIPGPQGAPGMGGGTAPVISTDPDNRAQHGTDGGVYVRDDLIPDPLAYYILAKA